MATESKPNETNSAAAGSCDGSAGGGHWRDFTCPKCGVKPGVPCGKKALGAFNWIRTPPHAARKRLARGES